MTPISPPAARSRLGTLANTLVVAGSYFLSRILGLIREIIISHQYGTSAQLDAFRATFGIIDLIYIVIAGGALGSAFIPVFAGFLAQKRERAAWRLASALFHLALAGLVAACALIAVLAEPIVAATVGRGFDPETRALTVWLLRLMIVQPLLLGLGGLAKATLESFDRFALPALASNVYNVGIILGALLAPWLGVNGLVIGVILGALGFVVVQLPGLRDVGAQYHQYAWLDAPGVGQVGRLIGPRLFGQAVWQINMLAIASFASLVGSGAVAANGYALQLMMLPHGLLALSVGTVIFPQLSRAMASGDRAGVRVRALGALRTVLFVALPASALMGALGVPIVRLLFERGAFDATSTQLTSQALHYYLYGLAAFTGSEIAVRTFYAMQDTRTPVAIGAVAVIANIGLGWGLLQAGAGLAGLALAFSIANTLELALLLALLGRKLGTLGAGFWWAVARMALAALLMLGGLLAFRAWTAPLVPAILAGAPYRWPQDFVPLALWTACATLVGAGVYAGLALLLRIPELRAVAERVVRRRVL
ncbi:MAG TPA: murein biosynthesis integral membrane protein MurJ [Roseiflexaceae bacterium]|nr:murein biosynthesis integral membrane protein MurJ [Roseiflexaceae bacterium]